MQRIHSPLTLPNCTLTISSTGRPAGDLARDTRCPFDSSSRQDCLARTETKAPLTSPTQRVNELHTILPEEECTGMYRAHATSNLDSSLTLITMGCSRLRTARLFFSLWFGGDNPKLSQLGNCSSCAEAPIVGVDYDSTF